MPAALERGASLAPTGSTARTRIAGLMDLVASATPAIKPPFANFCIQVNPSQQQ